MPPQLRDGRSRGATGASDARRSRAADHTAPRQGAPGIQSAQALRGDAVTGSQIVQARTRLGGTGKTASDDVVRLEGR